MHFKYIYLLSEIISEVIYFDIFVLDLKSILDCHFWLKLFYSENQTIICFYTINQHELLLENYFSKLLSVKSMLLLVKTNFPFWHKSSRRFTQPSTHDVIVEYMYLHFDFHWYFVKHSLSWCFILIRISSSYSTTSLLINLHSNINVSPTIDIAHRVSHHT